MITVNGRALAASARGHTFASFGEGWSRMSGDRVAIIQTLLID